LRSGLHLDFPELPVGQGQFMTTADALVSTRRAAAHLLCAFKQAGVSVFSPMFRRGVDFLLQQQVNEPTPDNDSWLAVAVAVEGEGERFVLRR
jgi:hypothetical protein